MQKDIPSARMVGAQKQKAPSWRLGWLLPAGVALLIGLDAGLLLLGVPAPITTARLPQVHGMLLTLGFVGTLISLEKATALGRWYGYFAPAVLGVGGLLLIVDPVPFPVAKIVLAAGALAFTLLYIPLWQRQHDYPLLTQLLGAALATVAAILWINLDSLSRIIPWLIGFLILTIAAERVELARVSLGPNAGSRVHIHAWTLTLSLLVSLFFEEAGLMLFGVSILFLTLWLIMNDVARNTIKQSGVTRYMAACILCGYFWLLIAAAILLFGSPKTQESYDALIHAIFLGYTFSMIMAHANTILPAVLKIQLPYRAVFWAPISLLQLALIVRIWLGDGLGISTFWQLGGILGVAALLLFVLTALISAIIGPKKSTNKLVKTRGTGNALLKTPAENIGGADEHA